eukprot:11377-Heterococcus_DN1.PRE.1
MERASPHKLAVCVLISFYVGPRAESIEAQPGSTPRPATALPLMPHCLACCCKGSSYIDYSCNPTAVYAAA